MREFESKIKYEGTEMYTWMLLAAARSKDWNRVIEALIALI